jgi:predicted dehydrogenase
MESKVRVGVIGTSWFADLFHLPQLSSHPDAVVAAICGRNRERAEEMAAKYGIPQVFTDYRDLIWHGEVDAVVVVTPDNLHYPMTMEALRAGKHVFCEKPLATNSQQAQEMYETAEQAGVVHMTVFTYRWAPEMQYMAELVAQGRIGKVYHGEFNFLGGFALDPAFNGWRYDASQGGGALTDFGGHIADLARLLVGEVRRVAGAACMQVERVNPMAEPSNDAAVALLEFETERWQPCSSRISPPCRPRSVL